MDTHERVRAAFLGGELDDKAAERFDAHLLECAECWRAVTEDRAGQAAAARLREPAPHTLADRVRMTIELGSELPDAGVRRRHRYPWRLRCAKLLAAGAVAVAVALAALATVSLVGVAARQPADPPTISTVVEAAGRMPSPTVAPSVGPIVEGQPWTARAGMANLRLRYYLLDGVQVLVARSDQPFDTPAGARAVSAGGMPWMITRGQVTVYCPRHDVLVAAAVPADRLVALAQRLPVN